MNMDRIFSVILSFFDDIIPLFLPSKKKGVLTAFLMIAANTTPLLGIILYNWNPFIILFIYWFESAIIGILNIFKMLISGAIQDKKFSPDDFTIALFLSAFFTVHYGMFMFVHGIFLTVLYFIFTDISLIDKVFNDFDLSPLFGGFIPEDSTLSGFIESELFPIAALIGYHLFYFFSSFICTGDYDKNIAQDYMMRPYKRIVIMQMTIMLGAFTLFLTGFRSIAFIIIWIAFKIAADLKLTAGEMRRTENTLKE
jgi:hypothetical protein